MAGEQGTKGSIYSVGSLFAGIGGFCKAFKNAGFRIAWANENDPSAVKAYAHNFPEVKIYDQSIKELSVIKEKLEKVDVLTAGFPCQPFSQAGNKLGFKDERGNLVFEVIRLLKEFGRDRPKILVMENVRNIKTHDGGKTISKIMNEVQAAGYWFSPMNMQVLNTRNYTEIPQNRERLYMVALSWEVFDYNNFEFPEEKQDCKDIREFLDLDKRAEEEFYFDEEGKYGKLLKEKINQGDQEAVYQIRRNYVRENKTQSVFTLTANMGSGGHNVPVIKDEWGIRKLTPIECLRLQGFKSDFRFPEGLAKSHQYRLVGNAVTVDLVEKIALECKNLLDNIKEG
jgi:DNA (cytosine-5)-methyltransferase 1